MSCTLHKRGVEPCVHPRVLAKRGGAWVFAQGDMYTEVGALIGTRSDALVLSSALDSCVSLHLKYMSVKKTEHPRIV